MASKTTSWSIGEYIVSLVRQDEMEGGTVLHFVVAKAVRQEKEGFSLFKAAGKKPAAKTSQNPPPQSESADQKAGSEKGVLIKYSRLDPLSREALVGVYVGKAPDRGSSAREYERYLEDMLYQAARLAAEESKRLGLS